MTVLLLSLTLFAAGALAAWLVLKNSPREKQSPPGSSQLKSKPTKAESEDRRYLDLEGPNGGTTTPWAKDPQQPFFRIWFGSNLHGVETLDIAPTPWGSNRRTFSGLAWPDKTPVRFDFADVDRAVDLCTGEILTPAGLWTAVLTHREDEPPNYVVFARCIPVIGALAQFSQSTRARFGQRERDVTTQALAELGHPVPPREVWSQLLSFHSTRTTPPPLTPDEQLACLAAARRIVIGTGRKPPDADSLAVADSMFQTAAHTHLPPARQDKTPH